MELIGEAVPDGDAGKSSQLLHRRLREAAVLDAVVDASQHARRILHALLDADLRPRRAEVRHMGALVVRGRLERAARARRSLFEDEGDVLALQTRLLGAGILGLLELRRQVQQILDLLRTKV